MSKLSALEAIRVGRETIPTYVSSKLLQILTRKGRDAWYDYNDGGWFYTDRETSESIPLPDDFEPVIGAACLLGAQGLAMGIEPELLSVEDAYYVHPDFIEPPEVREVWPNGYVGTISEFPAGVAMADPPCVHPVDEAVELTSLPYLIAHLNDAHDPRLLERKGLSELGKRLARLDPWPEERIVEWLRSLGYNGDQHG